MSTVTVDRPVRKDVLRNRALLLAAARELFAERGLDVSLTDVAQRSGLAIGTVYRHFANKDELIAAFSYEAVEALSSDMHRSLEIADPWDALVAFFEACSANQVRNRGLHHTIRAHFRTAPPRCGRSVRRS